MVLLLPPLVGQENFSLLSLEIRFALKALLALCRISVTVICLSLTARSFREYFDLWEEE